MYSVGFYRTNVTFQLWDFIGNVGSIIGWLAGMSIFSIVEIVFIVGQIIFVMITNKGY